MAEAAATTRQQQTTVDERQERERGTPLGTPHAPGRLILLCWLTCTGVATSSLLGVDAIVTGLTTGAPDPRLICTSLASGLGAASALVGLLFVDAAGLHVACLLGACLLAGSSSPSSTPTDDRSVPLTVLATACATAALLTLLYVYRQHRHGFLSSSVRPTHSWLRLYVPAAALLWALVRASMVVWSSTPSSCAAADLDSCRFDRNNSAALRAVLDVLTGSNMAVLLAAVFAFTADAWNALGSGQFHMVALDTVGLLFHFVTPLLILLARCLDRYMPHFTTYGAEDTTSPDDDALMLSVIALLVALSVCGVNIINDIVPLHGYLLARTYLHGQPNTRRVALTLSLADVAAVNDDDDDKLRDDAVLNVFVTLADLRHRPDVVRRWASSVVGVACEDRARLADLHDAYVQALGRRPEWCRIRNPTALRAAASKYGWKNVWWSSKWGVAAGRDDDDNAAAILRDVRERNGGNVIDLTGCDVAATVRRIVAVLVGTTDQDKYKIGPLSSVVKDETLMFLS